MATTNSTLTQCTGTRYAVNPDAPEEGTDVLHAEPCPEHPDAWLAEDMRHAPSEPAPDYCHHIGVDGRWLEIHAGRTDEDGAHIGWASDWALVFQIAGDPRDPRITERHHGPSTYGHVSYFLHA